MHFQEFLKQWRTVHQKMEEKRCRAPPLSNLKDYSPWLLQFQSSNHTHALEIPGRLTLLFLNLFLVRRERSGYVPCCNNVIITSHLSGQYTGRGKPLPEYHVKIAGFDERVSY